jgi:hypothetical protein
MSWTVPLNICVYVLYVHTTLLYGFSNETVAIYSTIPQDGIISFAFLYIVIDKITYVSVVDFSGNELLG